MIRYGNVYIGNSSTGCAQTVESCVNCSFINNTLIDFGAGIQILKGDYPNGTFPKTEGTVFKYNVFCYLSSGYVTSIELGSEDRLTADYNRYYLNGPALFQYAAQVSCVKLVIFRHIILLLYELL